MGKGLAAPSIVTATSLSFGARKRNVTLLSTCTSGETTGGGGVCAGAPASSKHPSRVASTRNVRFMISLITSMVARAHPTLIHQAPAPRDDTTSRASLLRLRQILLHPLNNFLRLRNWSIVQILPKEHQIPLHAVHQMPRLNEPVILPRIHHV